MAKTIYERSLMLHKNIGGKVEIKAKVPIFTKDELSLAYTPGVAEPCRLIAKNKSAMWDYTWKQNSVAVITDGTAVLGLGNIGPEASMPVMEGKAALFKTFGGINAIPLPVVRTDVESFISTVKNIAVGFGGINLEDIKAPECVIIEKALNESLDIPVFHDDQHGTAIVVTAALINAVKVVGKNISDLTAVICGAGAAGSAIIKMLTKLGVKEIYAFDKNGIITKEDYDKYDFLLKELSMITNKNAERITMKEAMTRADVFIGVSAPNIVTTEMVSSMKSNPIVFAMANPIPEISYAKGKEAGAKVMGTGRSDSMNQINNVLAFPGIFKGALSCRATVITDEMKLAAAYAIASSVDEEKLSEENIIPSALNRAVHEKVAKAVADKAREQRVTRI